MAMEHGKLLIELKLRADRIKEIPAQLNNIKTPYELYDAATKKVELPSSEICAAVRKNVELPSSEICAAVRKNVELPSSEICAAVNAKNEKEEQPPRFSRVNETYVVPYSSEYSYTSFHRIHHHPNAPSFIYGYPKASLIMPQPVVFRNVYLRNDGNVCTYRTSSPTLPLHHAAVLESKNLQCEIDLYKIIHGEEPRTFLIIKNIPYMCTSKMLLSVIEKDHKGIYDFLYLPIDLKNKCNLGYAFINMLSPKLVIPFYQAFHENKWDYRYNSDRVTTLAYAQIQGKAELVKHFQNSGLINEDKRGWPILFRSQGVKPTDQEEFPSSNVNIIIRQRDGSYSGGFLKIPEGDSDKKIENV